MESYHFLMFSLPRVAVHSRSSPPLIDDNGLMVEPNTATDIAIERVGMKQRFAKIAIKFEQVMIKRQPAPYGSCFNNWKETGMDEKAFQIQDFKIPYSQGVVSCPKWPNR